MKVVKVSDWEAFEEEAKGLLAHWERQRFTSNLLFRGQSDSTWRLETTLERYAPDSLTVGDYYQTIYSAKGEIESLLERRWEILTLPDYDKWLGSQDGFGFSELPGSDYMIYLRHHGFPSPLLDWSRSPYVAAFFAFNHASTTKPNVSIYAYLEHAGRGKIIPSSHERRICRLRTSIRNHPRHVLQQADYTICAVQSGTHWSYACHEDVFEKGDDEQDVLWKFIIPSNERLKVLRLLDRYNLNAYSLFGSEESLMETVALRHFPFRKDSLTKRCSGPRDLDGGR